MSSSNPGTSPLMNISQPHRVNLPPPSFRHLSVWAYLAMAVIVCSTLWVTVYAVYSCHYRSKNTRNRAGTLGRKSLKPLKLSKKWGASSRDNSDSKVSLFGNILLLVVVLRPDPQTRIYERPTYASSPSLSLPSPSYSPNPQSYPMFSPPPTHSGAMADIWTNPKLYPVLGPTELPTGPYARQGPYSPHTPR